MQRSIRAIAAIPLFALAGIITSCSLDSTGPKLVPIEQTTFAASLEVNLAASTRTTNGAYYRDITVGTGAVVAEGQQITVLYSGWLANGLLFDSNTSPVTPYQFLLGSGRVIAGWDEAIPGMRIGGRRQLIIPASLGYGPGGYGPIPGNAVMVFTVEVVSAP